MIKLLEKLLSQRFVGNSVKNIAANRNIVQTGDFHRDRRTRLLYPCAAVVHHSAYTAYRSTGNNNIANVQGAVLYQDCCNRVYITALLLLG